MAKTNSAEELLTAIDNKLGLLLKVSCIGLMEGSKISEVIRTLDEKGLDKKEIELVTGAKPDTIQKTLKRVKKKNKRKES